LLLHLQLLELNLLLNLHGFLLLWTEVVTTVEHLTVVGIMNVLIAHHRTCVHDVAVRI